MGIGVALNTQLMAGAATSTTESGAACAPEAAPKSSGRGDGRNAQCDFHCHLFAFEKIPLKYACLYS